MVELLAAWLPPLEGVLSRNCFRLNETCGPLSQWSTGEYLQVWGLGPS